VARKMNEAEKRSVQVIARVIADNKGKPSSEMRRLIQDECPFHEDTQKIALATWEREVDKCMKDYDKLLAWQQSML